MSDKKKSQSQKQKTNKKEKDININHQSHPSVNLVRNQGRVSKYNKHLNNTNMSYQPKHTPKKSVNVLGEAKMTTQGIDYWENKTDQMHHPTESWWNLKCSKDFETGMGQTLYTGGTLSRWTKEQVEELQRQMESTLSQFNPTVEPQIQKKMENDVLVKGTVDLDDLLMGDDENNKDNNNNKDDDIKEKESNSNKNNNNDKQEKGIRFNVPDDNDYSYSQTVRFKKFQSLKELDDLIEQKERETLENDKKKNNKKNDEDKNKLEINKKHKRTRTQALRIKLEDMSNRLDTVSNELESSKQINKRRESKIEELQKQNESNKKVLVDSQKLSEEMFKLKGALSSATNELEEAEKQLQNKDETIINLKRELHLTKQLNNELSDKVLTGSNLTPDDILNQRVKDAQRFALMLAAMQEQLEFERRQFVRKIGDLEKQLEHKDIQLNTIYTLYNKLVDQTQKKGFFGRLFS